MIIPAPTPEAIEAPILSSAFWPEVSPAAIRDQQRIDNTIPPARLKSVIIEAIATTNGAMASWRLARENEGHIRLDAVEAETIDDVSLFVHRYHRAVGCLAKALLLERYRDFDSTGHGDRKADVLTDPIDDCRRDHLNAIADIVGRPRSTVELI